MVFSDALHRFMAMASLTGSSLLLNTFFALQNQDIIAILPVCN